MTVAADLVLAFLDDIAPCGNRSPRDRARQAERIATAELLIQLMGPEEVMLRLTPESGWEDVIGDEAAAQAELRAAQAIGERAESDVTTPGLQGERPTQGPHGHDPDPA